MNKTKDVLVVVVVAFLISLAVNYFFQPNIDKLVTKLDNVIAERLGAIPGTSVDGDYFSIGGVEKAYITRSMQATSSIVCQFLNPFAPATTSVLGFSARISTGMTGTNVFSLSTTSKSQPLVGADGSSTPSFILDHSVASLAQDTVFWGPTSTSSQAHGLILTQNALDGAYPYFLTGTSSLVYRIASSSRGTIGAANGYVGTCRAEFQKN